MASKTAKNLSPCRRCGKMFNKPEQHYTKMHRVTKVTYDGIGWRIYRDDILEKTSYIHTEKGYEQAIEEFSDGLWKKLPIYKGNEHLLSYHFAGNHKDLLYNMKKATKK